MGGCCSVKASEPVIKENGHPKVVEVKINSSIYVYILIFTSKLPMPVISYLIASKLYLDFKIVEF